MKRIIFVLFILLSGPSWAEKFGVNSGSFNFEAAEILECKSLKASAQYRHHASKCLEFFENSAKQRLETEYLKLLSSITNDTSDLEDAQIKWHEDSIVQCKLEDSAIRSSSETDSDASWNNRICMHNKYIQRKKYLKRIHLENSDSIR
ncbi:hypothetical protein M0G74_11020 [Microbulbifer sp. CAU 1566]|uniref:hypothetical protein n=1 Tax=Microbulbifer sp. CAU 1566 TaxID=2933269 RepID=UPI002003F717|nr:hypothetical protein [Microbulbifer sp. CAU 1566]MCK7597801.1 hypothetical protein [Microbulbifer sp. CAU 1566]